MAIKCSVCNKELDAFSGGRCKICRSLVCQNCIASGSSEKKNGIICKSCYERTHAKKEQSTTANNNDTYIALPLKTFSRRYIIMLIITCFAILALFSYIIIAPYIISRNALQIVEFGPNDKLETAKNDLADISGSYVISQLKDMALTGKMNTAIRAIKTLGAQPNPEAVLILRQLQDSEDCPEYLKSVIIEALLENDRLYNTQNNTEITE